MDLALVLVTIIYSAITFVLAVAAWRSAQAAEWSSLMQLMPVVVPSNPGDRQIAVMNVGNTPGYASFLMVTAEGKVSEPKYHSARINPGKQVNIPMPWPDGVSQSGRVDVLRVVTHTFTGERIAVERRYDRSGKGTRAQLRCFRYGTKHWFSKKQAWHPLALVPWDSAIDDSGPLLDE